MANFSGNKIKDTFQRVLQVDGGIIQNGTGSLVNATINSLTASAGFYGDLQATSIIVDSITATDYENLAFPDDQTLEIVSGSAKIKDIVAAPSGGIRTFQGDITISGSLIVTGSITLPQLSGSSTQLYKASPYFKTVITNTNLDQVFYVDNYIELFWDETTTDDIELTILTNPTTEKIHVIRHNVTAGLTSAFDLNIASGRTPIDPDMDGDDRSEITIWAPSDSNWPFYRVTVVKSNSTSYTNTPAYVLVEKFT